jgi:hypothetical protein
MIVVTMFLNPEDVGSMVLHNIGILPHHRLCHIPEDHDRYLHRSENLKSCMNISYLNFIVYILIHPGSKGRTAEVLSIVMNMYINTVT